MSVNMVEQIQGTVTRISRFEFKANYGALAGLRYAGTFPSVRDAQAVIEASLGGGSMRRNWLQETGDDGIERWILKVRVAAPASPPKLSAAFSAVVSTASTALWQSLRNRGFQVSVPNPAS